MSKPPLPPTTTLIIILLLIRRSPLRRRPLRRRNLLTLIPLLNKLLANFSKLMPRVNIRPPRIALKTQIVIDTHGALVLDTPKRLKAHQINKS